MLLCIKLSYNFCQVHGNSESFNLKKDQQFFCTFEKAKMNLALVNGTGLCLVCTLSQYLQRIRAPGKSCLKELVLHRKASNG